MILNSKQFMFHREASTISQQSKMSINFTKHGVRYSYFMHVCKKKFFIFQVSDRCFAVRSVIKTKYVSNLICIHISNVDLSSKS